MLVGGWGRKRGWGKTRSKPMQKWVHTWSLRWMIFVASGQSSKSWLTDHDYCYIWQNGEATACTCGCAQHMPSPCYSVVGKNQQTCCVDQSQSLIGAYVCAWCMNMQQIFIYTSYSTLGIRMSFLPPKNYNSFQFYSTLLSYTYRCNKCMAQIQ